MQWPWLIGAGFFPGFLGILLAVIALKQLTAMTYSTLAYLEPISVVFYGWFFFGESLSLLQFCGCLLILASSITKTCIAPK
jgi:drug/metabolite transporter (DMT)-like permease